MVTKQVEAKQDMLGMLEDVRGRNTHYVVSYQGQPMAAVVPLRVHEEWERERRSFFDQMEETARRVNLPPEEAERLVAEAIEAVRRGQT